MTRDPQHEGNTEIWLWALTAVTIVILLILIISENLDLPVVQLNPDDVCQSVIYPDSDGRVAQGQCGMLPEKYTIEHVPFTYGSDD